MNSDVRKVCDICCQPTNTNVDQLGCEPTVLPGSDGSKVFSDQLRLYFILTKLFKCSEKESLGLLTKLVEANVGSENESVVLRVCINCDETVRKAFQLYQNLVDVKRKISELGETLTDLIRLSGNEFDENSESSLRQALRKLCLGKGIEHSNSANIKLEVDNEEFEEFEQAETFDDSYFDPDEDSIHDGMKAESREFDRTSFENSEQEGESKSRRHERTSYNRSGKITCEFCESVFTSELGFRKHERMHEESRLLGNVYDCSLCRHPNLSDSKLRRHMTRIHGSRNKGPSQSKNSGIRDSNVIEQEYKNLKESNDSDSDFDPKSTRKVYRKNRVRNRILKLAKRTIVQKTRRFQTGSSASTTQKYFRCEFCECVYESLYAYRRHLVAHENSNLLMNKFDCPQCKYPALSEEKLRRHIVKRHESLKNTCQICGHFSSKRCLHERHMLTEHNITVWEPMSPADIENSSTSAAPCNDDAGDKTIMISEITPSTETSGGKTYKCELCDCDIVYTTTQGLRKHMRAHERSKLLGNKHDCHYCRYPTITERSLRKHITHMHESNSSSPSKQSKLLQISSSSVILKSDVTENSSQVKEKPSKKKIYTLSTNGHYKCKLCKSIYTTYPGIRKHERMHTASDKLGNLYDCNLCRHPNLSGPKLKRHMTAIHGIRNKIYASSSTSTEQNLEKTSIDSPVQIKREQISKTSGDLNTDVTENSSQDTGNPCKEKIYELLSDGLYKCKLCESTYTSFPGIRKHERMHAESDKLGNVYDCRVCRHPNLSESNLNRHMTVVHNRSQNVGESSSYLTEENNGSISRDKSEQIMCNSDALKDGMAENSSSKIYTLSTNGHYKCKLCESTYTTFPGIRKHELMHNESDKLGNIYDCSICRHPNVSESNLNRHMTVVHRSRSKVATSFSSVVEEYYDNEGNSSPAEENAESRASRTRRRNYQGLIESSDEEANNDMKDDDWIPPSDGEKTPERMHSPGPGESQAEGQTGNYRAQLYHCSKCNVDYKSARGYERHEEEHEASESLGHKYDCHCGFPASSERRLRYHKRRAHLDAFTCSVCGFRVNNQVQLLPHMRQHYPSVINRKQGAKRKESEKKLEETLKCKLCKASYWYQRSYKRHMMDHEQSKLNGGIWDCKICGFPCLTERSLQSHRLRHGYRQTTCSICNKFVIQARLETHMRMHAEYDQMMDQATGLYRCKFCPYVGRTLQGIICHRTSLHRDAVLDPSVEYLLCPHCGIRYVNQSALKKHIKNIHENNYTYTCEKCGKGFDSTQAFSNHKITHEENRVKQHICDTCGVAYSHRHSLQAHIKKYHSTQFANIPASYRDGRRFPKDKEYKCRWCEMVFPYKYMLNNHMPTAHQDLYKFSCDECDKKYITSSSLKLHKEITHSHDSEKFSKKCQYCFKSFIHKHYLLCHYKFCDSKREHDKASSESCNA